MRRPRRAARRWGDRGASVVELALLAPALLMVSMLIVQFGLWFTARQAALSAAQAGATVARQEAATNPAWRSAAENNATRYYRQLNTHLLGKLSAHAFAGTSGRLGSTVFVTVRGPLGYTVLPGLNLSVSATAGGPVECFRPASGGGRSC